MTMLFVYVLLILRFCVIGYADPVPPTTEQATENTTEENEEVEVLGETRRIIGGGPVDDTRPYMVYLRPAALTHVDKNWLCGGVIISPVYILTSAACIEDIQHFYVVSGTHNWIPPDQSNECIRNGAMRAIWKCVPRTYRYDGTSFNNIRWMVNDIAVVMTEDAISFSKRVKGCDFIPNKIDYNNFTQDWEAPGTKGFIAGWGSQQLYTEPADMLANARVNSPVMMEAETIIINKLSCRQRWLPRYHNIINDYMICAKQVPRSPISINCEDNHAACRQLVLSEEVVPVYRRSARDPEKLLLQSASEVRNEKARRRIERRVRGYGGFCENDHGGPLVVGRGKSAIVVGIISAFRVANHSRNCYGPFLYTSVYNNRHLIQCAVYKDTGNECTTVLRDSSTVLEEEKLNWGNMPARPRAVYEDDEAPVLRSDNNNSTIKNAPTENSTTTENTSGG